MRCASIIIASACIGASSWATDFYCSNTARVQIAQLDDGYESAGATATTGKGRRAKNRIERFDVLQAYSGQPVLVGSTWLTACMLDPAHPDTRAAFSGLIGINPDSTAAMARSTGLVDRGIRLARDMQTCLSENAPAVGYSSLPLAGQGIKPCF